MPFNPKIIPKKIYANFLPINAVSGSSLTLILPNLLINNGINQLKFSGLFKVWLSKL